jgi:sec-independent protein translocase protein TatA
LPKIWARNSYWQTAKEGSVMGLSWWHILLVLVVFVLLFGAGRISGLMGDVAAGLKSFKRGLADDDEQASADAKLVEHKSGKGSPEGRRGGTTTAAKGTRKPG